MAGEAVDSSITPMFLEAGVAGNQLFRLLYYPLH